MTAPVQYATTTVALLLHPYIVLHGLDGPLFCFFSFAPLLDSVLAGIFACAGKHSGQVGHYRSWLSRCLRLLLLIIPYFALKCGTALFETAAMIEGLFSDEATFRTTPKTGSFRRSTLTSANVEERFRSDDMIAVLGLVIGLHRLVFLVSHRTSFQLFDEVHILVNSFLVLAMFGVNLGFFVSKYGFCFVCRGQTNLAKARKRMLFFALLLTAHSYILAFNLKHSEEKFYELLREDILSIPQSNYRGVYFMASDKVLEQAKAFLNSFRHFNPKIPLTLIPYDEFDMKELVQLSQRYDYDIYFDSHLSREIDKLSEAMLGARHSHFRKLKLWSGPYYEFLFFDIDSLVLDSVDFVWPLLDKVDVAVGMSTVDVTDSYRDTVWEPTIDSAGVLSKDQIEFSGQTGLILSSKRFDSAEHLIKRTMEEAIYLKKHFKRETVDQPLLNFLFVTSGKRYSSFRRMAIEGDNGVKMELWSGDHRTSCTTTEGFGLGCEWRFASLENTIKYPVLFLHFAGSEEKRLLEAGQNELYKHWLKQEYQKGDDTNSSKNILDEATGR